MGDVVLVEQVEGLEQGEEERDGVVRGEGSMLEEGFVEREAKHGLKDEVRPTSALEVARVSLGVLRRVAHVQEARECRVLEPSELVGLFLEASFKGGQGVCGDLGGGEVDQDGLGEVGVLGDIHIHVRIKAKARGLGHHFIAPIQNVLHGSTPRCGAPHSPS